MILSTNRKNPYIIGRPIYEKELFFGRDNLFNFIDANLNNGAKVILLQGQRRIGKSSVLHQIPNFVGGNNFVFVYFDLQDRGNLTLAEVLEKLATEIIRNLQLKEDNIRLPLKRELEGNTGIFSKLFLPQVFENLGGKNLVLLLDEFDVLSDYNPASAIEHFFPYLRSIISNHQQLFMIPLVGRRLDDMKNFLNLFGRAPNQEIGLLDEKSATQLITKPAEGVLEYQPDAIAAILKLSAGHPYLTQVICFQVFQEAEVEENWQVTSADVNKTIVDRAIESAEGGLAWFRDGLPIPEQVIFSAVAEAQRIAMKPAQVVQEPLTLLKKYGVVPTKSLLEAPERLVEWGFLVKISKFWEIVPRYKVKIELVRRWLLKRYSLRSEILELENLSSNDTYEHLLKTNPNHFQALFKLAEGYLEAEDFSKAVKFYQRAYKVNPIQAEGGLLESLSGYGQKLIEQRKLDIAQEQFENVLEIDPENRLAQDRLREIKQFTKIKKNYFTVNVWAVVLAVPLLIGTGIVLGLRIQQAPYSLSRNNPEGERFSSGEKTLLDPYDNENYNDLFVTCNEKFKKNNYDKAVNCFQELVNANRNEPEPLIYYNNSLARNYGNRLTIAVIVAPDRNSGQAKEILRGVAQAQDEYNRSQNQKTRLLEIIIVNDSNDEEISPELAQEIVTSKNILGVIGHNSSDATKAALEVYEKAKLAVISPNSTSTKLISDVFFRTVIDNSAMSKKLAEYVQSLSMEKVVMFYNQDSSYSNDVKEFFDYNLDKNRTEVRDIELTRPRKLDNINSAVQDAGDNQFQAGILFPGLTKTELGVEIAKANDQLPENQKLRLFTCGTMYNCKTLNAGQETLKGLILSVPWHKELDTAKAFSERAKKLWGGDVNWLTATSYDAAKAFIDALSNSGNNPTRSKVLAKVKEVDLPPEETSGQNLRFDPDGETTGQPILVEVVESLNPDCSDFDFRIVEE